VVTTYPDLSSYEYSDHDRTRTTVNVGWLGIGSTFETAEVDPGFRHALLAAIVHNEVNLMRGVHDCEFCSEESPLMVSFELADRGRLFLGNSEVHVVGADSVVYAAPTLIVHYIDAHNYRPPQQFIDAVLGAAGQNRESRGK
jgi:hypothetical protein